MVQSLTLGDLALAKPRFPLENACYFLCKEYTGSIGSTVALSTGSTADR